jgi:mono/diheme cytochrome c family protein
MYRFCAIGVLFILVLSSFTDRSVNGREVFKKQCTRCHGDNGTKGTNGARNLQLSHMKPEDIQLLVLNGHKPMPAFKGKLSAEEVKLVADYVISLRKQ